METVLCRLSQQPQPGRPDLDLASLDIENAPAHAEVWEKVVRKLRAGAMPPAGMPRPDDGDLRRAGVVARDGARRGRRRAPEPRARRRCIG